jgi:phasin
MVNQMPNYEIPTQMREVAEKSVDQAKTAFDGFMQAAHRAVDAFEGSTTAVQSSAKDVNSRAINFAEQNVAATFDFAQKVVRAKDLNEMVRLQTEFVQAQLRTFSDQAKELGSAATKAMSEAAKPRV